MGKCQDLKCEIEKIWKCKKVIIVLVVTRALGTLSKNFSFWIDKIEKREKTDLLQEVCLFATAKIIRTILDT